MVNTHPDPSTACSIEEHEVIFPLDADSKESFDLWVFVSIEGTNKKNWSEKFTDIIKHFLMTSLCSNVCFRARCYAKAQRIQGFEILEHQR